MFECECGREFTTPQGLGKHKLYCGKNNVFLDNGYECKIGPDGNIVYIHREVMEQKLGRELKPGELVHHKDENKRNNDPDNLELTNRSFHAKKHWKPIPNPNQIFAKGSQHGHTTLTEEQVIEIKKRLQAGAKQADLCREFKVKKDVISSIHLGKYWIHVQI